ncbi:NAD(P)-binding protein [Paracoccus sp. S-4012]|uniref:NAD(P)/FAD-dependent oxidoreductase n=1 Tax=Paracoccus sp. S-4012 TaxID=2665648 RepID=UPI0012AEF858|nr:FAD-dependent oxidoreductase [Paracoccus sp. S-4012]MRX50624.1 NAD(P)-binding protein [Paracoccus sp. S-4012]
MKIVIAGAGQAAASLAARLRALDANVEIVVIGEEPVAPYQRPPLSKGYLLGEMPLDRLTLRADEWWQENRIELRKAERVLAIDPSAREIETTRGRERYDALALTLGAAARRLPAAMGGEREGVHVVRSLADIDALAPELRPGRRLVVVGGGYIGLEAAAVARKLGLEVTVVEAGPRILGRVASEPMADRIRALQQGHGVDIVELAGVSELAGAARVEAVHLTDGRELPCDLAICGIGVLPETALAGEAGLALDNGIAVDAFGRTSDPAIWAAGDCASFPHEGRRLRLESVGNAIDMAEAVAANILGAGKPYIPRPWFWSDQFDAKLQIAGLATGADHEVVREGEGGHGASVWSFAGPRLLCVEALNDARAYMVGKRLIDAGRSADPAAVADPATDLKALMR